jgi:hypothetical protein
MWPPQAAMTLSSGRAEGFSFGRLVVIEVDSVVRVEADARGATSIMVRP